LRGRKGQEAFLRRLHSALKYKGTIVIAIENRIGLKYLLGCRDDHTGQPQISVLDAELAAATYREKCGGELNAFTYTMAEYRELLECAGYGSVRFYAAFPDYKLPQLILPCEPATACDEFFLKGGRISEHDGYDGSEFLPEFQSVLCSHYRSFAQLGISRYFAPSYYITAEKL
jgi:hypothetical protein